MPSQHLPPAQPAYVLRGHTAQVHGLCFARENQRLLSGDADGWVVSWTLAYKRPVAVWKAHESAVLGLGTWGPDRIITHGRDNKLIVWQLSSEQENTLDKSLPADKSVEASRQPWILHVLAAYDISQDLVPKATVVEKPILVAVPNAIESANIDIFELPSERRLSTICGGNMTNTGMVMTLSVYTQLDRLYVIAGYESGHAAVFVQKSRKAAWEKLYMNQSHSQPVLSLAVSRTYGYFITSSADANIVKHPLPELGVNLKNESKPMKILQSKHSGQQGLQIRSDDKIFATAGWDARIRVYSTKTLKELAVLKWHKDGCYATAFAEVVGSPTTFDDTVAQTLEPAEEVDFTQQSLIMRTVQQRRDEKAQSTHWLAVGSKDGKISLWDIY